MYVILGFVVLNAWDIFGTGLGQWVQVHPEKFFCTEYERSKTVADNIAMEEASNGLPIIILYPGILYGPGKMTAGNILARFVRLPIIISRSILAFGVSHACVHACFHH